MISDVFRVVYDALLQIIARLEIDISVAAVVWMLDLRIIPAVFLAHRVPQALDDQRGKCVFSYQYHFFQHNLRCVYL